MKLNRLLEITTILLNRRIVTAAELAERFQVSVRTIYRDIDVLSSSGIPVCTSQGANGGISIMEGYAVSRAALSGAEKDSVLFALKALQSTKYPQIDAVLEKLGSVFRAGESDWISIDFSPWGSDPNEGNKFTDIRDAIIRSREIEIEYINAFNERTCRRVEPLRLMFKSQAWYLWAYCLERRDLRMFRISRIKRVETTDRSFDRAAPREVPADEKTAGRRPLVHLTLRFEREALFRLYDDYDDDVIEDNGDGTYTVEFDFPEDEWVYSYILGFGAHVQVVSPPHIRQIIGQRAQKIARFYNEPDI